MKQLQKTIHRILFPSYELPQAWVSHLHRRIERAVTLDALVSTQMTIQSALKDFRLRRVDTERLLRLEAYCNLRMHLMKLQFTQKPREVLRSTLRLQVN